MNDDVLRPPCPICGKGAVEAYKPFCSKRCANVDLQRWLIGRYAIPAEEDEEQPDLDGGDNIAGQRGRSTL